MKRTHLLSAAAGRLLLPAASARLLILTVAACVLLVAVSASVAAQTSNAATPAALQSSQSQSSQTTAAQADEDFELNIDTRRINESDFHAETAVEADGARGLLLRVGVALRASDIEVLLRNVRGRVRFRASLAPVLRLLDARRAAAPAEVAPTPP